MHWMDACTPFTHRVQVEMHTLHTLRSSIPEPGDPKDPHSLMEWAGFVGVPHGTSKDVSFLILADPRFNQVGGVVVWQRGCD